MVDRDVTVRFYEITPNHAGDPTPEKMLQDIYGLHANDREKDVGAVLRLEYLDNRNGLIVGDITRVQRENLPSHVTDDTTDELPVDQIGHHAAFCYDPETKYIALQYDLKIGIKRVCNYLSQFDADATFGNLPILKKGALERFKRETPRRLTLKVSKVRNFRDIRPGMTDFEEALERFSELFDAPSVEISLSTSGEGKSLDKARAYNTVRRWIGFREEIEGIKKIEGETLESDDAFNFIKELLKEDETLELPNKDPIEGRRIRINYAKGCYDKHRGFLRGLAGLE